MYYYKQEKNLPCNKFFSYIPPHHKHIKARMNMEHKATEAALYENTHYRMLASSYFHTPSPGHYLRHYRA